LTAENDDQASDDDEDDDVDDAAAVACWSSTAEVVDGIPGARWTSSCHMRHTLIYSSSIYKQKDETIIKYRALKLKK